MLRSFEGIDVAEGMGYTFFFYDPGRTLPVDRRMPFATLATQDNDYDRASDLGRPAVFRLNVGVSRDTYRRLIGEDPPRPRELRPGRRAVYHDGRGRQD